MNTTMNNGRPQQYHAPVKDVEQVRRNYKAALSELTFNSKPIITNLTIMAQENQHAASVIVREIENQLRNNAPGQKLPVLYLIDSICKNVGNVYITHFARNMVNNYLDAYTLSDPTVRKSFERLLQTWKNGMPGGQPVFSRHVIESIERSIMYIREKTPTSRYPHPKPSPQPNNPAIHVNPNFLKEQPRPPIRDPRSKSPQMTETTTTPQMSSSALLSQLQTMLPLQQQSMNDPVSQIIGQIKTILPTLPTTQASSIEQYLSQIAAATPPIAAATVAATPSPQPRFNTVPAVPAVPSSPQVNTADLLKSLTSMGYLSTSNNNSNSKKDGIDQFGPFILDSKDLQIPRPGAIELLYSAEPLQCKQCGFRYPKTDKGQAKMDAHLDSHFRQNRKMKERSKRGLSRSWFVTVEEWVSGEGGELTSQQAPAFLHDEQQQQQTEDVVNPDENMVIMPDEEHRKPCPICGERFVDFWNDDEEEWMYKNAIAVEEKIYHATCYADAVKSGTLSNVNSNLKRKVNQQDEQTIKQPRLA